MVVAMRLVLILSALALSACVSPQLGVGMTLGAGGVHVSPTVSAGVPGGGRISYSP